jgi:hypothetical protein
MITENTVFIVGAGASRPFGYPTGIELRRQICAEFPKQLNFLLTGQPIFNRDHSPKAVVDALDFSQAFRDASVRSIDRYLAINQEFSEIGKMAIALSILDVESRSKFDDGLEDNWYFYLYNRMVDGFRTADSYEQFGDNKVTFITFNYDRSLEHYLFKCLRATFPGVPEKEIVKQLNRIPIHHVYGQVDTLPWQGGNKAYGAKYGYEDLLSITHNIKTMFERTGPETQQVASRINGARAIYFLGFGYDASNMKTIGLPEALNAGHNVFGTYKGAKQKEANDAAVFLIRTTKLPLKRVQLRPDCGCLDLLREHL